MALEWSAIQTSALQHQETRAREREKINFQHLAQQVALVLRPRRKSGKSPSRPGRRSSLSPGALAPSANQRAPSAQRARPDSERERELTSSGATC